MLVPAALVLLAITLIGLGVVVLPHTRWAPEWLVSSDDDLNDHLARVDRELNERGL